MSDKFPDVIYLQVREDVYFDGQITWCQDKIYDTDVKYIRADNLRNQPSSFIMRVLAMLNICAKSVRDQKPGGGMK